MREAFNLAAAPAAVQGCLLLTCRAGSMTWYRYLDERKHPPYYRDPKFTTRTSNLLRAQNAAKKSLWHERRRTMSTQPQCGGDSGRSHPGRQEYARVRMTRALALALLLARSRSRSRSRALCLSHSRSRSLARPHSTSLALDFFRARARSLSAAISFAPARPRTPSFALARLLARLLELRRARAACARRRGARRLPRGRGGVCGRDSGTRGRPRCLQLPRPLPAPGRARAGAARMRAEHAADAASC